MKYKKIKFLGPVSAGECKVLEDTQIKDIKINYEGLPKNTKDLYIAKVKGDSMTNFDIKDKDYILLSKTKKENKNGVMVIEKSENERFLRKVLGKTEKSFKTELKNKISYITTNDVKNLYEYLIKIHPEQIVGDEDRKAKTRNKTMSLSDSEYGLYKKRLIKLTEKSSPSTIINKTINQDIFSAIKYLPSNFVDLIFVDPPYNLTKTFNSNSFKEMDSKDYENWLDSWLKELVRVLKPNASIYICGDWKSSSAIFNVASKYFFIRNRITFEREKGRGAKTNWKNCSEDIWFCTNSKDYNFNVERVKLKKKVIAPYRDNKGDAKDWVESDNVKFRMTFPSNLWTDITIPFWSMSENTIHPTQKPEKLIAKILLASSEEGDVILDPFLGSGTTSVVARKLGRNYVGIEKDELYSCLAEKRLEQAKINSRIQGYINNVFCERNMGEV